MGTFLFSRVWGGGILVVAFKLKRVLSLMSQANRIGSDRFEVEKHER